MLGQSNALDPLAKNRELVPEDTIRKTWNAYSNTGKDISHLYDFATIGTNKSISQHIDLKKVCKKTRKIGSNIRRLKGKAPVCTQWGHVYNGGGFTKGTVPLGTWAEIYNGLCLGEPSSTIIYDGGQIANDVATKCASMTTEDPSCFINYTGPTHTNLNDCFVSGIQYPAFCQLGDYVLTNEQCAKQCSTAQPNSEQPGYCEWALDRVCTKKKGQPLTSVKNATVDMVTTEGCRNYCGGPSEYIAGPCEDAKKAYCGNIDNWPEANDYCFSYWKERPPNAEPEVCSDSLVQGGEITTPNQGCGKLCQGVGSDINHEWCNVKRMAYCSLTGNLFTKYCYDFCKSNPELCGALLMERCQDKETLLGSTVPGTELTYSNFCGCLMPPDTYTRYADTIRSSIKDRGMVVRQANKFEVQPSNAPECIFPECGDNSIMTPTQKSLRGECNANCLNQIMKSYSHLTDSDLLGCTMINLPFSSEPALGDAVASNEQGPISEAVSVPVSSLPQMSGKSLPLEPAETLPPATSYSPNSVPASAYSSEPASSLGSSGPSSTYADPGGSSYAPTSGGRLAADASYSSEPASSYSPNSVPASSSEPASSSFSAYSSEPASSSGPGSSSIPVSSLIPESSSEPASKPVPLPYNADFEEPVAASMEDQVNMFFMGSGVESGKEYNDRILRIFGICIGAFFLLVVVPVLAVVLSKKKKVIET